MAEETMPVGTWLELPAHSWPGGRPRPATQLRLVSVFRQGWIPILVALRNHHCLPLGRFVPELWPQADQDNTQRVSIEVPLAA